MKLNIANPSSGLQKTFEIDDEKKLLPFFEKRMGAEVPGDSLGDEFKGYVFRIGGGNDKEGFPMMQGILTNHRVRILFKKGMKCYRPRRTGEMKRKSVRGAIVGGDLSVLSLILVKKGAEDIAGLTDAEKPRRLGPKRASRIRRLFNLSKSSDIRKFVVRREVVPKNPEKSKDKIKKKAPKIQRLITRSRINRKLKEKRRKIAHAQQSREKKEEYHKLINKIKHQKEDDKKTKKTINKKNNQQTKKNTPKKK